jgi:hypothetical protein
MDDSEILPTETAAAAAPDTIPTFEVEDLMEVVGPGNNTIDRTLSFTVTGDPPSQARHRISWKGVGKWKNRTTPVIYDPSAPMKTQYAERVSQELRDLGLTLPYFTATGGSPKNNQEDNGLIMEAMFCLQRPPSHYDRQGSLLSDVPKYPRHRDIDNMLKFAMDALQHVVYHNDACIRYIIIDKEYSKEAGFTKLAFKPFPRS